MIQDVMRKHKKLILWLTLGLIIGPFVVWGGYSGLSGQHQGGGMGGALATVEGVPVDADRLRMALDSEISRRNESGQRNVSYRDLEADGTAQTILQQLMYQALLRAEAQRDNRNFDRALLVDELKKDPSFQDDKGQYDPKLWNAFLDQAGRRNWNAIYASMAEQVRMRIMTERIVAPARVLESEIRKQYEDMASSLRVKYVTIDLPERPTEEQIQKQYADNIDKYALPERRGIQFVSLSLLPDRPTLVDELVTKARAGEDFAALAKEHSSGKTAAQGGDLDWVTKDIFVPPHRQALFALEPGQVSDAVLGPGGYYIYKAEEARTDAVTQQRQVRAREIYIESILPMEERTARIEKARSILDKARTAGSLEAAATEAGLTVMTASPFSGESTYAENIPSEEIRYLAGGLADVPAGSFPQTPISTPQTSYIVYVTNVEAAVPRPLEAVRDRVEEDAVMKLKQSPEYKQKMDALLQEIAAKAKSLQDIAAMHPELNVIIRETRPFSMTSFDFQPGDPMWNRSEVFTAVGDKEPGAFGGPVRGFDGKSYFVELVAKVPPDAKAWEEEYPKEKERIQSSLLSMRQRAIMQDYLQSLYESNAAKIKFNQDSYDYLLGTRDRSSESATPEETAAPSGS
ncbi:MAG TPA: peptidyl-prolyl cis-trans isomerase [Candidatus Hydrogenedentes bacterium]|nr:peptidyl-prolyl cis-trans isomerase [Candidatus Hydrogenedentota bacterium]HOS02732.1 peptidyl-prolyl cis-trans isomerase [Candidatus Hydrogenedentota bacterium]